MFQPSGLIGNQRIGNRVGFVKTITGKLLHQVKDMASLFCLNPVGGSTRQKYLSLHGHFFRFLLTHRTPEQVGISERIPGQNLRNLHHLLLIQHDTKGVFQYLFQAGMKKIDVFAAQLPVVDEIVCQLHRTRSEQRHQRHNVRKAFGLDLFHQVFHPPGFKLEYSRRLCLSQICVNIVVFKRNGFEIDQGLTQRLISLVYAFYSIVDNCQGAQPKEIKLDQPGLLNVVHVELGHQTTAGFVAVGRYKIGQSGWRNNNTTGMTAYIASKTLKLKGHLHDFICFFTNLHELF